MTRAEFIASYGMPEEYKTNFGYQINGRKGFALECACGDETCKGWAMVSESSVEDHMELYAPKERKE